MLLDKINAWRCIAVFENIFETVVKGSSTIFLDVNEDDYFFSYDSISKEAAEEITNNYFRMKQKDGSPRILDVTHDNFSHTVKITVEVDQNGKRKAGTYIVPDALNVQRNQ